MSKKNSSRSFFYCVKMLRKKNVIAYPTESMFGLGCDPNSKTAVIKLLTLKKRKIEKGLILVASEFNQVKMYVNENYLSKQQKRQMFSFWPGPFTFLLPASKDAPLWLTGKFNTVAVRISAHLSIIKLCNIFGQSLISTSANLTNMPPSITRTQVFKYFGKDFPLLHGKIGREKNPSKIINISNGKFMRYVQR